jgi:hypothetical protein
MANGNPPAQELDLVGTDVAGTVDAVFRWGVIVDLGLSRVGFIDVLYIDEIGDYQVGQNVVATLASYDPNKDKFLLRPHGQIPISDRLRAQGFNV